jgi:hypothetical protein
MISRRDFVKIAGTIPLLSAPEILGAPIHTSIKPAEAPVIKNFQFLIHPAPFIGLLE